MRKTAFEAIVGTRGQITVPVAVRRDLDLKKGDLIDFVKNEWGQTAFRPRKAIIQERKGAKKGPGKSGTRKSWSE